MAALVDVETVDVVGPVDGGEEPLQHDGVSVGGDGEGKRGGQLLGRQLGVGPAEFLSFEEITLKWSVREDFPRGKKD